MLRKKSHEQQWLETLENRFSLSSEEQQQLAILKKEYQGELYLDQLFEVFSTKETFHLDDLTLKHQQSIIQIDKLFLVGKTIYLLDAKNYQGSYALKEGKWYKNEDKLEKNILQQLQRAQTILEKIIKEQGVDFTVEAALVFTNKDCQLSVNQVLEEEIVCESEIPSWLRGKFVGDVWDKKRKNATLLLNAIHSYIIPSFKTNRTLEIEKMNRLRTGICCEKCHHFHTRLLRHKIICLHCGHQESKEKAYTRTICDFGTIFHQEELTIGKLRLFFGKDLSEEYLRKILKKHFIRTGKKSKKASYVNFGVIFAYWFADKIDYFKQTERRIFWKD